MENHELPKKELSEFDQYMISKVEDEAPNNWQTWSGIGIGIGYLFILSSIVFSVMLIFNPNLLNPDYDSTLEEVIAQVIAGLIVVVATCFIIGKRKIIKILKGFTLNNLGKALTFVGITWVAMILVGYIETAIFGNEEITSSNQESVESIIHNYKLLGFIFVAVMAPIVEEIIFRYFIFRGMQQKTKTVYAFIITVASFVAIHYLASILAGTLLEDLKSILGYIVPAFLMTFLYYKNKNLATPIMFHMAYNGIQWILMILLPVTGELGNSSGISGVIQCLIGG